MNEARYFLTVDWCNKGRRGVFCSKTGESPVKDEEHTQSEMVEALGPFWIILSPQSVALTEQELKEYCLFIPLAEYSDQWGVACKTEDVPEHFHP